MKNWITKLIICIVFLYILLSVNSCLAADQLTDIYQQQLNTLPVVENLAIADDSFADNKREDWRRFRYILNRTDELAGLFTLHHNHDSGQIYLELEPEQLNKNYLATVTLESGIGESGIYSGLPLADFLFYFQRVNNNLHFVIRNVKFRTEISKPEQRSLARSFSDSVLYSLAIDSIDPRSKNILLNLDELLMQDLPGLTPLLKYYLQADYRLEISKSYFGDVTSLPENLEIDAIYGFSSTEGADLITLPDSRALSLKVHYSFSQLRENNGYIPRLADDRVGYFITAFQDLSAHNASEPFVRYINRWHLEPSNPHAPLSPPKKPIVYWIENAVPFEYRDAIREGVLMWNQAFAKAGFQNAIEVRQMPDDADWQPADVRYNTIRWFNSLDAGFARGPMRVNPFTGEILDADIIVDANMVRSIQQGYRTYVKTRGWGDGETRGRGDGKRWGSPYPWQDADLSEQAAMGTLALSLLQNVTPNSTTMREYVHQYLRSLIAHEVGHTLGLRHNFHGSTMLAPQELNNTEITRTKGLTGSVMDYLPVNIAPQGVQQGEYFPSVVGPYDEWAIEYGYRRNPNTTLAAIIPEAERGFLEQIALASPQPELSYATDEDIWDINPLANVWDMSSDVLLYSQWQMDNARMMWQRLDQRYLSQGESYSHLRVLFNKVLKYYFRNAALLAKYIGGQSFRRLHVSQAQTGNWQELSKVQNSLNDSFPVPSPHAPNPHWASPRFANLGAPSSPVPNDTSWTFVPVSLGEQRQALTKLQEYVFADEAFSFSPQLLNQLAPSRWQHWGSDVLNSRLDYPIHESILYFQSTVLRSLLDSDRLNRLRDIEFKTPPGQALSLPELFDTLQGGIWTEVLAPESAKSLSSIRRALQREYLNILLEMVLGHTDVPEDGRTLAWYELRQLQKAIDLKLKQLGENLDVYTLAHLEVSSDRITKALNAQLLSK
ncbi:MAG: zinc-dependent metalloprotease [Desmonostoc vinosum HA7617-LM4]|jgi:hypothetical protein|nr:zinc-dependent metalloprotease [Desmonostoc vinosum HA7617-LM4]